MTYEYFMTIIVCSWFIYVGSNFLIIFHQKNLVFEKTGHLKLTACVKKKFPNSKKSNFDRSDQTLITKNKQTA